MIQIYNLIDDSKCFEKVRQLRWPEGVRCPRCGAEEIKKRGKDEKEPHRQRYQCSKCRSPFDDLTDTLFAGHHQPLRVWMLCLSWMGLNLSDEQIAKELDQNKDDVHWMTIQLREGMVLKKPQPQLRGDVECDELYVVAGHKGHPEAVEKRAQREEETTERQP